MPLPLLWAFALALALALASFLNVCITRLPRHRSIAWPGSHCPRCQAPVRMRDNIPVLSWVVLGGRCRDCRGAIPIRYLLVELAYPGLVAACLARHGFTLPALSLAVFCFFALGLAVMDLETMLLPDAFTLPSLGAALLFAALGLSLDSPVPGLLPLAWDARLTALAAAALAAAAWALLLLTLRLAYYLARRRHGLGLGDVKLAAMLAAWLGAAGMAVAFLVGILAATILGVAVAARSRRLAGSPNDAARTRPWGEVRLPLGAFLCAGGLFAAFFGGRTVAWYLHLFQ